MPDSYIVQSHRGAGSLRPENTLESFEFAWRLGTVPEADVRATSDGVVVAFHDDALSRVVSNAPPDVQGRSIGELTWEQVAAFEVGSRKGSKFAGQRVPRLSSVFQAMAGKQERLLYLDVKEVSLEPMAALAREHGVTRQLILASTVHAHLQSWKQTVPESRTLLWIGGSEERLRERMCEMRAAGFDAVDQLQFHVRVGDLSTAEPFTPSSAYISEAADELQATGILFQALPIGTREVEAYHRLMSLGVQSFATDYPEAALEAVRSYGGVRTR